MEWIADPGAWIALLTLTALEIVLGIDNIVFIAVLSGRLPPEQQARGRSVGLLLAMVMRIGLLFSITFIMRLTRPLFEVMGQAFSGRDLILAGGGLFLLAKATLEIHGNLEGETHEEGGPKAGASFFSVVTQIMLLDVVFSLDSVITAVGLATHLPVMVAAIVIAVGIMLLLAGSISRFVEDHPTIKILALSFLLLIGVSLIAEGFSLHIPKGYIYFAMAFSTFVEMLNLRMKKNRRQPVKLNKPRLGNVEKA